MAPDCLCFSFFFLLFLFLPAAGQTVGEVVADEGGGGHSATSMLTPTTVAPRFGVIAQFQHIGDCLDPSPYLAMQVDVNGPLPDESNVTVTVSGVLAPPDRSYWVGLISPPNSSVEDCLLSFVYYVQTGDLASLPLLCHYPVKAQYLTNDPNYLACKKKECKDEVSDGGSGVCHSQTCSATLTFHLVNIRSDVEFVLFGDGFIAPCVLLRSAPLRFANPSFPSSGHLSSIDSTATSMRLTRVSGDGAPQQVQYEGRAATSQVTTFTKEDMCTCDLLPSPAKDFGWHNPGFIHSAVMAGLSPSSSYSYRYGSDSAGWSEKVVFKTPPAAGAAELRFLIYGDMGKEPLDPSTEHYIQPGSRSVAAALTTEVAAGTVESIFHIGDISYATGFIVEWDFFLRLIAPFASHVTYMTCIGNHERDYAESGSVYETPDSGGECGVPYETYFPMPTPAKDKPWYSIEQGPIHFCVISTEHTWTKGSEQYDWIEKDLSSVDRTRTPWLIFTGHRPMYSTSVVFPPGVDSSFVSSLEPVLLQHKVDLAFFGHVHNYERTCAVYNGKCKAMPSKGKDGVETYNNTYYAAPVQVVVGSAGFSLDGFPPWTKEWSLKRISEYGYCRVSATRNEILVEFVNSNTLGVDDRFKIIKEH